MAISIIMMELKRLRKNIIIGIAGPAFYAALIMVFYIAFAGVMGDLTDLFDNASLQVLLKAFSMDVNTFSYILSFYVAYNGVYVLLMGVIFAATLGVHLFSKELKNGTYEFLYGNPISRTKIFFSKSIVVVIYLLLLNLIIFLVGFTAIEILKTKSPMIPWMSTENIEVLNEKVDENNILTLFDLNDELFYSNIYSNLEKQFTMEVSLDSMPEIDTEVVTNLLAVFLTNPDGIYDEMLENPDRYMPLFNLKNEKLYHQLIETQKGIYFDNKRKFASDANYVLKQFRENPRLFLEQTIKNDSVEAFSSEIGLTEKEEKDIFIYYSLSNFIELSWVTFVVMLTVACFSIMLTVVIPKGRYSSGLATGIAFIFYIVSMMSNMTDKTEVLKYFSPLAYINMDVMSLNYKTETWAWIAMISVIVISSSVALISFNKSDLIS